MEKNIILHHLPNYWLFCFEKKFVHISLLRAKWNETHFCYDLLIYFLCFDKKFACIDVSFLMILFQGRVYITFITRHQILFLSKWPQWNNICNDFSCKKLSEIEQTPNWIYFILPEMKSHIKTHSTSLTPRLKGV